MINPAEIAFIVGFTALVILVIIAVIAGLLSSPRSSVQRPRKGSLPPLHWGYKPRQDGGGLPVNRNPPRPPKGRGGGSH